ncbi:MAG: vacuolar protein sorting-associated family 26 protein [Anaerolineae bacterium]
MENQQPTKPNKIKERLDSFPLFKTIPAQARFQVAIGTLAAAVILAGIGLVLGWQRHQAVGAIVGTISGLLLGLLLGWFIGTLLERLIGSSEGVGKLEILLDQANSRYMLGDNVSGQVLLQSNIQLRSKGGRISLTCQGYFSHAPTEDSSEGAKLERSAEQLYIQETDVIPPGDLRRGSVQGFAFQLPLPAMGLATHHGYLCVVKWSLHAQLVLENESPLEAFYELLVESQPAAVPPETEYQQITSSRQAQLSIVLPRAVYAEGEIVQGKVNIKPLDHFNAEELRMVLLRIENTPTGDNKRVYIVDWDTEKGVFRGQRVAGGTGTTYYWLEGEANLSEQAHYVPLEAISYPFAIPIPQEWRPSMQIEQGSVTWKLGVTLVVENEPELNVFHELFVHTCVPKISQLTSAQHTD